MEPSGTLEVRGRCFPPSGTTARLICLIRVSQAFPTVMEWWTSFRLGVIGRMVDDAPVQDSRLLPDAGFASLLKDGNQYKKL